MSIRSLLLRATLAASTVVFAASCYYEGYYSNYGTYDSYGYSGGGVSFVYTSSDRWFYDPVVFCYYDRYRRCYYDPYLGGYYPVGYCPRPIYGAPHPGGWRPGQAYCPPPSNFRDRRLSNYHNRVDLLRSRQYSWAGSVRERNDGNVAAWQSRRIQSASQFPTRQQAEQRRPQTRPGSQGGNRGSWDERTSSPGRQPDFRTPGRRPADFERDRNSPSRGNWQDRQAPSRDTDRGRVRPGPAFGQQVDTGGAARRQQEDRIHAMRQRQAETRQPMTPGRGAPSFEPRPSRNPSVTPPPPPTSRETVSPAPGAGADSRQGGGGRSRDRRER